MTIDKQALREAAEKVNSGEWSYEEFNRLDLPGSAHIRINGRDAIYCLKKPVGGVEQSRAVMAFIAAFNPKVALALLDECAALAAENAALNKFIAASCFVQAGEELAWYQAIDHAPETPATDAFLAEVQANARNEGINYAASRLAAAFNHGFIDKPVSEVLDVTRMILSAKEDLANAPLPAADGLSGEYAEKAIEGWATQLRKGVAQ
ncbi:ead/Ea22-like family protein [Salmonella enterica]|nr:ead/Ea22-like family protein [Salmonella enterica]ECS9360270.1 hypothetical protein [Salmonella enterica subsp. enterica serovar Newport]EDS2007995.1 hypothetical protein [Salmonella enterica subsp. enterica serovar Javiana]EAN9684451.1 ead/Ea22-like family protein [Salmonella enterica]EAW0056854.1 hypothetical protein [Salmonella enterica]